MSPPESRSPMSPWFGLFTLSFGSAFLIGLCAMVLPQVLGIVLVVGIFSGGLAFHYLVWGWWIDRCLRSSHPQDSYPLTSTSHQSHLHD
ncbi:MAG: hypothetical protein KatS3mg113_0869 [Planctomycetaceae bacterium]|nr:MAG: hypothetical protein KatS3mg113_0869 [Planctomycetaceae bacterium]